MTPETLPEQLFEETRVYPGLRPDLLARLPAGLGRVLDVGCGPGGLGEALVATGKATRVCGTDLSSEAIRQARSRLEQALIVDLDRDEVPFSPQSFDTLIYADVLEHLKFPWTVVRAQRSLLRPGGRAFCSLPNVGHYRVVWQLLRQRWEYTTEGVLDYTHLRFFTRASLRTMFSGAGYQSLSIEPLYPPSRKVKAFNRLTLGRLHDLSVGAWWLEARSSSHSIGRFEVGAVRDPRSTGSHLGRSSNLQRGPT